MVSRPKLLALPVTKQTSNTQNSFPRRPEERRGQFYFRKSGETEKKWGLVGAVITYQHSFSGYGLRPRAELVTVGPLAHYNFNKGYYLRSSGIWNLNYGNHVSDIPVGFGAGKVTTLPSGIVMNLYVEPQYSIYHTGAGSPIWQVLIGLNFHLPNPSRGDKR
jgi:hypothetical protein